LKKQILYTDSTPNKMQDHIGLAHLSPTSLAQLDAAKLPGLFPMGALAPVPGHLRLNSHLPVQLGVDSLSRHQFQQHPGLARSAALPPVIDPILAAQYGYAQLLHGAGTRKNATRESTAPLKAWLKEHQKNPYPTKGEKIMLALISGMTLTQVSTWFANARRRLKKENKWSPDAGFDDDEENLPKTSGDLSSQLKAEESGYSSHNDGSNSEHNSGGSSPRLVEVYDHESPQPPQVPTFGHRIVNHLLPKAPSSSPSIITSPASLMTSSTSSLMTSSTSSLMTSSSPSRVKPRIWSLVEMTSSSHSASSSASSTSASLSSRSPESSNKESSDSETEVQVS
jgi:hypothetical protein